jgi:hypothetical protein
MCRIQADIPSCSSVKRQTLPIYTDGLLNVSNNDSLNFAANQGAIDDVKGLTFEDMFGWQTVSPVNSTQLLNNFFNLKLDFNDDVYHYFEGEDAKVTEFILFFGDSLVEGIYDNDSDCSSEEGTGWSSGWTNTLHDTTEGTYRRGGLGPEV